MSGPAPVLAVTAVCGRRSSQPTKSTRTGMPVASVKALVLARKMVSSGSTNLLGRRTRKVAPFSAGCFGGGTSATGMAARAVVPASPVAASAPAPRMRVSRRVSRSIKIISSRVGSGQQALAGRFVEQVDQRRVRCDADGLAGPRRDALAEGARHRRRAEMRHHLRLGAGRLDDMDGDRHAVIAQHEMLGPY